jgi:acyl-CoA thioesterase YciA
MKQVQPNINDLTLRIYAMPKDANPHGDMFGGWLVSLMDMAGSTIVLRDTKEKVVTVAIDKLTFLRPVFVGDEVSCYSRKIKTGTTSMQVMVEAWVQRPRQGIGHKVTEGVFTYVAIDSKGKPTPI